MANRLNGFDTHFASNSRDEPQPSHPAMSVPLPNPPTSTHDPSSYMAFDSFAFTTMSQGDDVPLQNYGRPTAPQPDLEGRLSNVMLAYDPIPSSGVSIPVNLDASNAFAYDVPATYPTTSMGIAPQMDQSQFHPTFSPYPQTLPQQIGQYTQHPDPNAKEPYTANNDSSGSFEDSSFSRASDQSQKPVPAAQQTRERTRPLQASDSSASYRAPQPVAIQPKKPPVVKSEWPVGI